MLNHSKFDKSHKEPSARKRLRRIVTVLSVIALCFSFLAPIGAAALSINGIGKGIAGANSKSSGAYVLKSTTKALGFRFTLVDKSSGLPVFKNGLQSFDVYNKNNVSSFDIKSRSKIGRFESKHTKMDFIIIDYMYHFTPEDDDWDSSGPYDLAEITKMSTGSGSSYLYNETTTRDDWLGISLPETAEEMPYWSRIKDNINALGSSTWGVNTTTLTQEDLCIVIEPIYYIRIGGIYMALTPTETAYLAAMDGTAFKSTDNPWKTTPTVSSSDKTWKHLTQYTHGEYPMSLHLAETISDWGIKGGSELKTLGRDKRGNSYDIIHNGYGMMVVFANDVASDSETYYSVHHYYMQADGSFPTSPSERDFFQAEVGDSVTVSKLKRGRTGYTYSYGKVGTKTATKATIAANGKTVISLYYTGGFTIKYDGNGATSGSTAASTHTFGVEQALTANGFVKDGATFLGWSTTADGTGTFFADQEVVSNLTETAGGTVTLYAQWSNSDAGPTITATDRWFTLKEAQAGNITLESLMTTASAVDSPVGRYTDFAAGEGTFTLIDYSASEFTAFTAAGSVTVTYYAVDLAGNTAYKVVTVYIVDKSLATPDGAPGGSGNLIRFISCQYFLDSSGGYVDEAHGGLTLKSKWIADVNCANMLASTLANSKTSSGWSNPPVYSFHFSHETVELMKDAILAARPGSGLSAFYERFLKGT